MPIGINLEKLRIYKALTQNTDFQVALIIPNLRRLFKAVISIDMADIGPYRTIVMQAQQTKRVTIRKFFEKYQKKYGCLMPAVTENTGRL